MITRFVKMSGITMPLHIEHHGLAADERIDDRAVRTDVLSVDVEVKYANAKRIESHTLDGVWNYGSIYEALCFGPVINLKGPLESVLDDIADAIEASMLEQELKATEIAVRAKRLGLAASHPELHVKRSYKPPGLIASPPVASTTRSAGIVSHPLVVKIDHSWCQGSERVEHKDIRIEAVNVSFSAETKNSKFAGLDGLFNYASLVHLVDSMAGMTLTQPTEFLCDLLSEKILDESAKQKLDLLKVQVEVERTAYARCSVSLGIEVWPG